MLRNRWTHKQTVRATFYFVFRPTDFCTVSLYRSSILYCTLYVIRTRRESSMLMLHLFLHCRRVQCRLAACRRSATALLRMVLTDNSPTTYRWRSSQLIIPTSGSIGSTGPEKATLGKTYTANLCRMSENSLGIIVFVQHRCVVGCLSHPSWFYPYKAFPSCLFSSRMCSMQKQKARKA